MQSRERDEDVTPGASKQHRSETTEVFWHEAGPVVEQPETRLRLKRSADQREEKGDAEASGIDADSTARDKI